MSFRSFLLIMAAKLLLFLESAKQFAIFFQIIIRRSVLMNSGKRHPVYVSISFRQQHTRDAGFKDSWESYIFSKPCNPALSAFNQLYYIKLQSVHFTSNPALTLHSSIYVLCAEKYCRRLGKYCRHLKKHERRFGSMTLNKAAATCLIEMQGYATFSAGFTPKCTPNNFLKSSHLSIISAGLHSFLCNPAKVS